MTLLASSSVLMDVETACRLYQSTYSTSTPGCVNATGKMNTDMHIGGTYKLMFSSWSHKAVQAPISRQHLFPCHSFSEPSAFSLSLLPHLCIFFLSEDDC